MKSVIEEEFTLLNSNIELFQVICRSGADRCQICLDNEGKQFEH
ncbi:unnamed protein product, partial [Rotaria sp. Silwood2]